MNIFVCYNTCVCICIFYFIENLWMYAHVQDFDIHMQMYIVQACRLVSAMFLKAQLCPVWHTHVHTAICFRCALCLTSYDTHVLCSITLWYWVLLGWNKVWTDRIELFLCLFKLEWADISSPTNFIVLSLFINGNMG